MTRFRGALALALLVALQGCISTAPVAPGGVAGGGAAAVLAAWDGRPLVADERLGEACALGLCLLANPECIAAECELPCGERSCERVEFEVAVPPGFWDAHDGGVSLAIEWREEERTVLFSPFIEDADGRRVAAGRWGAGRAAAAFLDEPAPGRYAAVVVARVGEGAYRAAVTLDARPATAEPLLPNLVTLPPTDLRVESPVFLFPPPVGVDPALALAGAQGCGVDEIVEQGARRCLRYSNAVANVGAGALEVRLATAAAATTAATGAERWVQRLYAADGTWRDEPVGPATFHKTHAHYHYAGLAQATVYRYDLATGERGEPLNDGRKAGFCFGDVDLVDVRLPSARAPRYRLENCEAPTDGGVYMGITPGWLDLYGWMLPDQYVDITGAEDGTYVLVSVANADGTLLETSLDDNAASVVFELVGDEVRVLPS